MKKFIGGLFALAATAVLAFTLSADAANPVAPTPPPGDCSNRIATTQYVCTGATGGTVTSISAGCGTSTFGPPITTSGTIFALEAVNQQTGTTYAIQNSDCGSLTNLVNASPIAVTIAAAGGGGNFTAGWYNDVCDLGAGTATITPTTSTIGGSSSLALSTGKCARIVSDGTNYQVVTYGGGGGTPGGSNTQVQFNNSGAFGGDAGFTYAGNGQATLALGTITTNLKALAITGTWNAAGTTFDAPLFMNVTNTASAAASLLADLQIGGATAFSVQAQSGNGQTTLAAGTGTLTLNMAGTNQQFVGSGGGNRVNYIFGGFNEASFTNGSFELMGQGTLSWSSNLTDATATADSGLNRAAAKVVEFSDGNPNTPNVNGWMNWAGEARLDADFSATSNTTLANVTGSSHSLTVSLQASRKYIFHIFLPMVTGATAGGIKVALGGTATVTNLIADGICMDGPTAALISTTQVSALTTAIAAVTNAGTTPKCQIDGTFEVNAAGTFTVQFAQNASSGTASTVKRGAYMQVNDAP